jgi:hypothetical protein
VERKTALFPRLSRVQPDSGIDIRIGLIKEGQSGSGKRKGGLA